MVRVSFKDDLLFNILAVLKVGSNFMEFFGEANGVIFGVSSLELNN
jgi:hypothetical protein